VPLPLCAGSWAELEISTQASDGSKASDTWVWLSHLRSYEGMGVAQAECVSGCTCEPTKLDGTWERRVSLFTVTRFQVSGGRRSTGVAWRSWKEHAGVSVVACRYACLHCRQGVQFAAWMGGRSRAGLRPG